MGAQSYVDLWSEIVNVLCLDLRAREVCMAVGGDSAGLNVVVAQLCNL